MGEIRMARKFEFERSFDTGSLHRLEIVPGKAPPPALPTFSQEDLDAARAEGFAAGSDAGRQEMTASIEQQFADATARLAQAIEDARTDHTRLIAAAERQAAETMLDLVENLLPALLRREGANEIRQLIEDAFKDAVAEPRLIIRCNAALKDEIERVAAEAAEKVTFEGTIKIVPMADFAPEDCRIEWATGGVERSPSRALASVKTAIRTAVAEPVEESMA